MATENNGFVLDASVIAAIIMEEATAAEASTLLLEPSPLYIGAPTLFEVRMVLLSRGLLPHLDAWWATMNIETLAFGQAHAEAATEAFERFGKGRNSTRLNLGDCMAYATAKLSRTPLLYVGDDFDDTDIPRVKIGR